MGRCVLLTWMLVCAWKHVNANKSLIPPSTGDQQQGLALGYVTQNSSLSRPARAENITLNSQDVTIGTLYIVSAVENVLIAGIVYLTKSMHVYAGCLLINQCVADFLSELLFAAVVLAKGSMVGRLPFYCIAVFKSVSLHTLTTSTFNLYLAICKASDYRRLVNWRRLICAISVLWIANVTLQGIFVYGDKTFFKKKNGITLAPNYTKANGWIGITMVLCIIVIPLAITVTCQYKIFRFGRKLEDNHCQGRTKKKIQLSMLVSSLSAIILLTAIPPHILRSFGEDFNDVSVKAFIVMILILILCKLPLYLFAYKPFLETVRYILNCAHSRSRIRQVHPDPRPSVSFIITNTMSTNHSNGLQQCDTSVEVIGL